MHSDERLHRAEQELVEALAACLEALREGGDALEGCLRRYPRYRAHLEGLLEVARQIPRLPAGVAPSVRFRERARAWVLGAGGGGPVLWRGCAELSAEA